MLKIDDLRVNYGGIEAVKGITLAVPEREIVTLIGANGAGKTTAFNCITGVYEPTNGRVSFLGETMVENYPQGKMQKDICLCRNRWMPMASAAISSSRMALKARP